MPIKTADLMTTRVVTLTPDMTLSDMDTLLLQRGISGAPVTESRRLVGVASQADIIRTLWEGQHEAKRLSPYYSSPYPIPISALEYMAKDSGQVLDTLVAHRVRDVMTKDPLVAHPDDPIDRVAERMVNDQIHRLPVVEEGSHDLIGIITTIDLARAITRYDLVSVV